MKIFISHSAEDRQLAQKLAAALKEAGLDVFDVYSDVYPGENWAEKLSEALREANAMILLVTRNSLQSPTLTYDLSYALGNQDFKGRVFPIVVADDLSPRDIPWILQKFRVFELRNGNPDQESLREISRALATAA